MLNNNMHLETFGDPMFAPERLCEGPGSEGGWNENGELLLSLDPFGGDGRYSAYVVYAPPPSCYR